MIIIYALLVVIILSHILLLFIFPNAPKRNKTLQYDTCIVLGCPTRVDGKLSRMQRSRMDKAIALYKDGIVKNLLISGAGVRNDFVEAKVMSHYAQHKGVNKKDLYLEMKAVNTFDNVRLAKDICNKHTWEYILVVTSHFHIRRSNFFVKKFFDHYAMEAPIDHEHMKHYLAEYIRMWNTLRYEITYNRKYKK